MNTLAKSRQRGAVLIIALVLLVVLTLLALSATQDTVLEEHMAGNMRSENVAFQAAEASLRVGEVKVCLLSGKPVANSSGSTGYWLLDAPDSDTTDSSAWWQVRDASWWSSNATAITDDLAYTASDNLSDKPRYVIEERGTVLDSLNIGLSRDLRGRDFYQVTTRGVDMGGRIEVYVRSTYARRF